MVGFYNEFYIIEKYLNRAQKREYQVEEKLMGTIFNGMKEIRKVENSIRNSFKNIREEMDVHLDSINENTIEINSNFDYLLKLESKVDKLTERIDEIQMMFEEAVGMPSRNEYRKQFQNIELNNREQEVFMVLYTSNEGSLSYSEVARKLGFTVSLVEKYITSMIMKGIPIIKTFSEGNFVISIDEEFKNLQAKENILNIKENIIPTIL